MVHLPIATMASQPTTQCSLTTPYCTPSYTREIIVELSKMLVRLSAATNLANPWVGSLIAAWAMASPHVTVAASHRCLHAPHPRRFCKASCLEVDPPLYPSHRCRGALGHVEGPQEWLLDPFHVLSPGRGLSTHTPLGSRSLAPFVCSKNDSLEFVEPTYGSSRFLGIPLHAFLQHHQSCATRIHASLQRLTVMHEWGCMKHTLLVCCLTPSELWVIVVAQTHCGLGSGYGLPG